MENQHNGEISQNNDGFDNKETTGAGYSEGERNLQDSVNSDTGHHQGEGAETLVDSYNINDKAHSNSSLDDFIKTTSNFHHAEKPEDEPEDEPETDSIH